AAPGSRGALLNVRTTVAKPNVSPASHHLTIWSRMSRTLGHPSSARNSAYAGSAWFSDLPVAAIPRSPHRGAQVGKARTGEPAQHDRRAQRRDYGIPALVLSAARPAATVLCLFEGVAGQHAVTDRGAGVQSHPRQAIRHGVADVVEMRRTA